MDLGTMILLLILGGLLLGSVKYRALVLEVRSLRYALDAAGTLTPQDGPSGPLAQPGVSFDPAPLAGAGDALKHPPSDFRTLLAALRNKGADDQHRFPLGWDTGGLVKARFVGDVNHILITGQTDAGKDNAVAGMFLTLAASHAPQRVQFAIIDGKGLGWQKWANKAHTWLLATDPEDIAGAMAALVSERQRRKVLLAAADVEKWDEYEGGDLPLLCVFVSELLLLENAVGSKALTAWLNTELTAARAFGIRYLLATQTASNFDTQWRSQISLFLAGFQPAATADKPNTGLSTSELESLGGIPPSKLPAPSSGAAGVFTALQGRDVATVRTSYLSSQHRAWVLSTLPDKALQPDAAVAPRPAPAAAPTGDMDMLQAMLQAGQPLPLVGEPVEPSYRTIQGENRTFGKPVELSESRRTLESSPSSDTIATSYVELPLPAEIVPYEEQRRIIEAAPGVKSKRQLSLALYNVDGGTKSTWVKLVCDALGLLPGQKGGA